MTFETTIAANGGTVYFVDGYRVPADVYDTLYPSKLFPRETGWTVEEAMAVLDGLKKSVPPPPPHRGPYFALAINDAHPLRSDALAVHPKQIEAVKKRNAKHGLNVRYDRRGRPVFTDAAQRRKLMKIEGVRQQNSAYGH